MSAAHKKYRVGELRPSQLLFTYGIGAIIDLPHISTMVMGLDDWETIHTSEIGEARLLQAVRSILGPQVKWLRSLPAILEQLEGGFSPFDESATVGIPEAPFPRWMICPRCSRLSSLDSCLFHLNADDDTPYRISYVITNCAKDSTPPVLTARC